MDLNIVVSALGLVAQLSFPIVIAALAGAIVVGLLQTATQISDDSIYFAGKFSAVAVAVYMYGSSISSQVSDFTRVAWSMRYFF